MARMTLLLLAAALVVTGCSTTRRSRREAAQLAGKVQQYRVAQQKRIETLNREYQLAHRDLMAELERLYEFQVDQDLELASMRLADDWLSDWKERTLPRSFRDSIAATLEANRARRQSAEAALQKARVQYASSYQDAVLQLKKLDQVKADLDKLAIEKRRAKDLVRLLREVYKAYEKARENSEKTQEATR